MRRSLMLVLAVALAALVFAPAAFAQDDNPTGDDLGGVDRGGLQSFDDNPTEDDVVATSTATATPTSSATPTPSATPTSTPTATPTESATPSATVTSSVSASPRADASALPVTGGLPLLSIAAGILLVGAGIMAAKLMRRTS